MENVNKEQIWKGLDFWSNELKNAGVFNELKFFNDVITEQRPPHPESGFQDPVFVDGILDGKKCDVYHTDHVKNDTFHRLFIHIKE